MRIETISEKAPYEVIPLTFNFGEAVSSIDSATISIAVKRGTDVAYSSMLFGTYVTTGPIVQQLVRNGVDKATYFIRANIISGNEKYSLACYLPVRELS